MKQSRSIGLALAALVAPIVGVAVGLPVLAMGLGGLDRPVASCPTAPGSDPQADAPTILGPATLTPAEVMSWWESTGQGQPRSLALPVDDVIALYLSEAEAEGVRGDLALAQAVYETGWFASGDTQRNNFAGIAHYDGQTAGDAFPDVTTGVRAHVQLLKKYAAGNGTDLAHPDVAPDAGARATTWDEMAGTWATAADYWDDLSHLHAAMLSSAGHGKATPTAPGDCTTDSTGDEVGYEGTPGNVPLATAEGITVHASIASRVSGLVRAARADGYELTGGGYRSPERQIELRRAHCGTSHYAIYEMPSSQCSPPTARPGSSNHERGLAIDIECNGTLIRSRSSACFQWIAANAPSFGLYNLPSEPWHWSVDGR